MTNNDLKRDQARAPQLKLEPMLAYLRMQNKGFSLDDQLWVTVSKAQRAIKDLVTVLRCGDYKGKRSLPKRDSQPQNDGDKRTAMP